MLKQFEPLSGAATDTLWCLFYHGPTWDGNVPSKCGRNDLYDRGLIERHEGWQWLNRAGVMLAMGLGFDRKKDIHQNRQRRSKPDA